MPNPLQPIISTLDLAVVADRILATLIRGLLQSGFTLVARPLVSIVRLRHTDHPVGSEQAHDKNAPQPHGPFKLRYKEHSADLLIYVPRSLESYLIDEATGRYGYSHVAIDCGEVELLTGKRVMVEATVHVGVHRSFLDKYGRREFIRIPLAEAGIDTGKFRDCVLDKIGEPYDNAEVLTWGQVDDPAKQVCSDLAADCLPTKTRQSIVRKARSGQLGRHTVSIHGPASLPLHIFVSPNGFARFYGAPKGHKIKEPDTLIHPRVRQGGSSLPPLWKAGLVGLGIAAGIWIGWQLLQPSKHDSIPPQ